MAGGEPAAAHWEPVVEAYRHYALGRRVGERVEGLRRAVTDSGFDGVIGEAFRRACRADPPHFEAEAALPALEPAERLDLLARTFELFAPIRSVAYPTRGPVPDDSEVAGLGISIEALQRIGENHPPLGTVFPYQQRLLRERCVEMTSPLSGRPVASTASLFVLSGNGRPLLIYHFIDDGEPYFVFVNTFGGAWSGLFFPDRDLMVSVPPEPPAALGMFRALVVNYAVDTVAHLGFEGRRSLALLTGTMNHFGHSIMNEYEAYHRCAQEGLFDDVELVLRGWANFAPHDQVFPELAGKPVLQIDDAAAGYRAVVEGRHLVTRPTCNYWFSKGLGDRLRVAARRHVEEHPSPELATATGRWPLLWIEIRSNDRRWVNQEEELPQLIDALAAEYPDLGVITAGWSRMIDGNPGDEAMILKDAAVVENVRARLTRDVPIFDVTGTATIDKMAWADVCDVFVSTFGTGLVFCCYMARRPGVIHTNLGYMAPVMQGRRDMLVMYGEDLRELRLIAAEHITDEDPGQPLGVRSHHLSWEPVFEALAPLLHGLTREPGAV